MVRNAASALLISCRRVGGNRSNKLELAAARVAWVLDFLQELETVIWLPFASRHPTSMRLGQNLSLLREL
jgi:hypothetical protein